MTSTDRIRETLERISNEFPTKNLSPKIIAKVLIYAAADDDYPASNVWAYGHAIESLARGFVPAASMPVGHWQRQGEEAIAAAANRLLSGGSVPRPILDTPA